MSAEELQCFVIPPALLQIEHSFSFFDQPLRDDTASDAAANDNEVIIVLLAELTGDVKVKVKERLHVYSA